LLQKAARQRTDSHNPHRLKGLRANSILQDVAVNGSNVGREHAPKHALNFGPPNALRIRGIAWNSWSTEQRHIWDPELPIERSIATVVNKLMLPTLPPFRFSKLALNNQNMTHPSFRWSMIYLHIPGIKSVPSIQLAGISATAICWRLPSQH